MKLKNILTKLSLLSAATCATLNLSSRKGKDTTPTIGSLVDEDSPFIVEVLSQYNKTSNLSVIFGNDKFTLKMGNKYGTELKWKPNEEDEEVDLVGSAVGLYASYSGALHDMNYTSIEITSVDDNKIDISFNAYEGEHHMVLFKGLDGFYSYFVNKNLPILGEFRTLFRLNPEVYQNAHTSIKDEALPVWPDDYSGTKVSDETWLNSDGTGYITKYDWSSRLHEEEVYGVYGSVNDTSYGFWLISPGRDYFCGDQIKQELLVHRESSTGDVVLLNMLHGTHFEADTTEVLETNKIWGPYLWYFNDGSISDANRRLKKEQFSWPYKWLSNDNYLRRGSLTGRLVLSNGSPASNVNLFLGTKNYTMVQGASYQYYGYTDEDGYFSIDNIRTEKNYYLQAFPSEWSSKYTEIGRVTGNFTYSKEIKIKEDKATDLGNIKWTVDNSETIWQIGTYDRTTKGFKNGSIIYENMQTENSPANFEFTVGQDSDANWPYSMSKKGTWTVSFNLSEIKNDAELYISIAGFTDKNAYIGGDSTELMILANNNKLEKDVYNTLMTNDKSTYRSSSFAGNWFYSKLNIPKEYLKEGENTLSLVKSTYVQNMGIMWDSIKLNWKN